MSNSDHEYILKANACYDYLKECNISIDSTRFNWESVRADSIPIDLKRNIFRVFTEKMKEMYEKTWGWDENKLWDDNFSERSCYLLIHDAESTSLAAFCHFQVTKAAFFVSVLSWLHLLLVYLGR